MKKILKKIGVIGLALAVLSPFIDIPSAKAAEESCTTHLQNYLFLDVNYGLPTEYRNGYQTYTHFPFVFDTSSGIEYKDIQIAVNDFDANNTKTAIPSFFRLYNNFVISNKYVGDPILNSGSTLTTSSNTYNTITTLWHGDWARFTESANLINPVYKTLSEATTNSSSMETTIYGAKFKGGSGTTAFETSSTPFSANDLVSILSDVDVAENDNKIWLDTNNNQMYIPFSIKRTIKNFDNIVNADDFIVGHSANNTDKTLLTHVYSKEDDKVTDSYEAYVAYKTAEASKSAEEFAKSDEFKYAKTINADGKFGSGENEITVSDIDINVSLPYYWPAVLSVEYKACSSNPINAEEWAIEYFENTKDTVKNMPKGGTYKIGEKITLGSAPSREGYKFQKWCENSDGTGNCYEAGTKDFTSTTTGTIKLYAIWGDTKNVNNNDTGIVSYIIGFAAVGIIAGTIYVVSKKKNLFKQI